MFCRTFLRHCSRSSGVGSTIFALSSAPGKSGVAVIRVSGPSAELALTSLTKLQAKPVPRVASLHTLYHPETGEKLDRALTLWFPGPRSFTGEDCAELQVHGGVAVVAAVLHALGSLGPKFRPAEPGEFTKRAFFSGKLDLIQAEGLIDLIQAETEMQRKQALRTAEGEFCGLHAKWREQLLRLVAALEAYVDFSESDEVEDGVLGHVEEGVRALLEELSTQLSDARAGERLRHGVHVAIVGAPNVGKSSLLNWLVQRPAAIVSPLAGTTRDLVETRLDVGGYPVVLVDTAGLREGSGDEIEDEGIRRAIDRANCADLLVLEATKLDYLQDVVRDSLAGFGVLDIERKFILVNKADLLVEDNLPLTLMLPSVGTACLISCKTGWGMSEMLERLVEEVTKLCSTSLGESPVLTRSRHMQHLRKACKHLEEYLDSDGVDLAIDCQHLRWAMREVGCISGKVSSEQILDVIFADFCIGK